MSSDNEVAVKIVADASGVAPGVDQAKDQIAGLAPMLAQLNASVTEMATSMRQGFAQVAEQLAATKTEMAAVEHETEKEGITLREVGARMKETALSVHEGVESFNKFKAGIREAMEVYAAFFAVERIKEWSEELGESAEKVEHMSKQFGMSTAQVQQFKGIAIGTGISVETIAKGLQLLDREAERSPEKFQKLGIEIKAGASQMDILRATAERFSQYTDGPTKIAAAMELMHKSGVEMIPVLDKGAEGLDELIAKSVEYGVVNDRAQTAGMALAESVNEGKLAFEGLKQTLTEAFGPLLTEITDGFNGMVKAMTDSYEHGGAVKTIFEAIVSVVEGFGEIFNSIGSAVVEMFHEMGGTAGDWGSSIRTAINVVVGAVKVLIAGVTGLVVGFGAGFDDIRGYLTLFDASLREKFGTAGVRIDELKITFQTLGTVINDVMSLHWGSIAADWEAGMNRLANVARDGAAKVKNALAGEQQEAAGYFKKEADAQSGYAAWLKTLFQPHAAPARTGIEDGGGTDGEAPNIGKQPKEKKPKDDLVQQLEAELTQKKLAWSMEQDAQDSAQAYSLESESSFWKEALGRQDLTTKDRLGIEQKYLQAHGELVKQDIQKVIEGFKTQIDAAKGNAAQREVIVEQEAAFILQKYGAESTQSKQAQDLVVRAKREAVEEIRKLEDEKADHENKLRQQEIANEQAAAKFRVAMGVETNAQLIRDEIAAEQKSWAVKKEAWDRKIQAATADRVAHQNLLDDKAVAEKTYQAKITQLTQQAVLQRTAIERQGITTLSSSWAQSFAQLATLQKGFGETLKSLYQDLQQTVSGALATIIQQWLTTHLSALLVGGAASKTAGEGQISVAAAIAGANGVASMALAPWPLDIGAPEFGASMAAAAGAFSGLLTVPMFDVGALNISRDQFAMVHGGETIIPADQAGGWRAVMQMAANMQPMVLPASLSSPMSAMFSPPAANKNAPAPTNDGENAGSGDIHLHFNGPTDKASLERWFKDNHQAVGAGVRHYVRMGGKTT